MGSNIISKKKFLGKADIVKILLSMVFIAVVFLPLIRMFMHMDSESIRRVAASPTFATSIVNSIVQL